MNEKQAVERQQKQSQLTEQNPEKESVCWLQTDLSANFHGSQPAFLQQ